MYDFKLITLAAGLIFSGFLSISLAVTYSTEDITDAPAVKKLPNTRDYKVHRTRMPGMPNVPELPNVADSGGYPTIDGGMINLHSYPLLVSRRSRLGSDWDDGFWPGLLGIDLSYSWSGNSGRGEFAYCGYCYLWGDNSANSDAYGCYQTCSAVESDPNTTISNYTTYSAAAIQSSDYGPSEVSDANEPPSDVPERPKCKTKADKDK